MKKHNRPSNWVLALASIGMLGMPMRLLKAQSLDVPAAPAVTELPGLATYKQSFCNKDVTFIGDTDHRDGTLQSYYTDPRFLDAAQACGIKAIGIEISIGVQPAMDALAVGKISLKTFAQEAAKLQTITFRNGEDFFESVGNLVIKANERGIPVVAANVLSDDPRTPDLLKLIEAFRTYTQASQPAVWEELKADTSPYDSFNPSFMTHFPDFASQHEDEISAMTERRIEYRQSTQWNIKVLGQLAGSRLGLKSFDGLDIKETIAKGLQHTIIIFGAGHGAAMSAWFDDLKLSAGMTNFEPYRYLYNLHLRGLTPVDLTDLDKGFMPLEVLGYPGREAVIFSEKESYPASNNSLGTSRRAAVVRQPVSP